MTINKDLDRADRVNRWRTVAFAVMAALVLALLFLAWRESGVQQEEKQQAQVEKFNLAQQIAVACKDPSMDESMSDRLCKDAATIVREGPQGAQGVPGATGPQGVQGTQGLQGIQGIRGFDGATGATGASGVDGINGLNGIDGTNGVDGAPGKDGVDGKDGAAGIAGTDGADGQPPFSWTVFNENGDVRETCTRADPFDPAAPTYTCTR